MGGSYLNFPIDDSVFLAVSGFEFEECVDNANMTLPEYEDYALIVQFVDHEERDPKNSVFSELVKNEDKYENDIFDEVSVFIDRFINLTNSLKGKVAQSKS